jgi:hypothetical protein
VTKKTSLIDEKVDVLDKVGFFPMSFWNNNFPMWSHELQKSIFNLPLKYINVFISRETFYFERF